MITAFTVVAGAAWLTLTLSGGGGFGAVHISSLAAAVGCGVTALAASARVRTRANDVLLTPTLLVVLPVAAALAVDGHTALPLVGCVLVALVTVVPRWRAVGWSLGAGEVGVGLVLAALALGRNDLHPGVLTPESTIGAGLLASGAAALAIAAGLAPEDEDALRFLVVPAVVIGWVVTPLVDGLVPVAAALALLTAVAPATRRGPAPLLFAAGALAAVGPTRPSGALLAAAVVLITALGPAMGWAVVLPGTVAAALALAAGPGRFDDVVAGAAVAVALIALAGAVRGQVVLRPRLLPAAVLGVWLVIAPVTWAWAGRTRLADYQQGATRALAAGLLALVVAWLTGQLRPPAPEWHNDGW